jgi:hypothetical protein
VNTTAEVYAGAGENMKKRILGLAMAAMCATTVLAADWQTVADVTAGGEAKELIVNRTIRLVQIECTEGSVIVNTLWIREGDAKSPIKIARRFTRGEGQNIDLGNERQVTGFRISDGGKGTYKIQAQ